MRLAKARVRGYRSIIDSGWFEVENGKTILVGPNEAGKSAILQALQKLNPPKGVELFDPLRDYPRALYDEDIEKGGINPHEFTVVEGHFSLETDDVDQLPDRYKGITFIFGRRLDNSAWNGFENAPSQLVFSDIERDLQRLLIHFKETAISRGVAESTVETIETEYNNTVLGLARDSIITTEKAKQIKGWLKKHFVYLDDDNARENSRYERIESQLELPLERDSVLQMCVNMMPRFILFSNYFRIKPSLHLQKLTERIASNSLDDSQYDYGNICLLKFLGFTPQELADVCGKLRV